MRGHVRERKGQEDAVDPTGGSTARDVHGDVGAEQVLQQEIDATPAHGPVKLVRRAVHVDGEGHAAVQHEPEAYLVREFRWDLCFHLVRHGSPSGSDPRISATLCANASARA
jgi:hypothetical protein